MSNQWKVGDMARYVSLACHRRLILHVCATPDLHGRQTYCCLSSTGYVCYESESDLLTLNEWLAWFGKFQDELTGKEFREYAESARSEFVPPDWWGDAVERAMEPFLNQSAQLPALK